MEKLAINPTFVMVIALLLVFSFSFEICDASGSGRRRWRPSSTTLTNSSTKKKSKSHGSKSHHNNNGGSKHPKAPFRHKSPPLPPPSPKPPAKGAPPKKNPTERPPHKGGSSAAFNVLDFGAQGDGSTDDTKAFEAAWAAACKLEASTMIVPDEYEFLVGPISFSGPHCEANIVFKLDGTIMAPTDSKVWGKGLLQWLEFTKLKGITVMGKGTIDGRGSVWWDGSPYNDDPISDESDLVDTSNDTITVGSELSMKMPSIKPTALRFYGSYNVSVTGIKIQNSQKCHLKFDNCMGVLVHDMTVSSPGDSPNTDGIHLQNSKDVLIYRTDLACGDDCISIQTGCSNVYVHNVKCGPGHGISIGGLGKDNTKACVSNITVRDVTMHNTMNGVRIKTWQGGSGCVQGIMFSDIQVSEVEVPIMIDQFYCDKTKCKNQTSAVSLSGITYERIRGTYTVKPLHLACSDSLPCIDLTLNTIQLKPAMQQRRRFHINNIPFCWQTFGELTTSTVPPIDCLQIGKPSSKRVQSHHDIC